MKVEVPIIVYSTQAERESEKTFHTQTWFFTDYRQRDRDLPRAMEKLVRSLQKGLRKLARSGAHHELARRLFSPDMDVHNLDLRIELRNSSSRLRLPVSQLRQLDRSIGVSPFLPDLWFEFDRPGSVSDIATRVYADFFRAVEKDDGREAAEAWCDQISAAKKARLDYVEFSTNAGQVVDQSEEDVFAVLGSLERMHGGAELERVGRCLDHYYPDRLERYTCDTTTCDELVTVIESSTKRPVLIVGRPLVGKTSLVHEMVYRRVAARATPYSENENVWLLAPQRLISGMMYVGQWEDRLLAILNHAKKRLHILYFDDVVGLFQAGKSCSSDLSVADVLKPYVERGDVRIIAEITPEALRVLRELDRGFADLFELIRLEQPSDNDLVPILLSAIRRLERDHGCRFDIEVLPAVLELTRRYCIDTAYPGKAVQLLEQLAVKNADGDIDRQKALVEFRSFSGLDLTLLDTNHQLNRQDIVSSLEGQVLGQSGAVAAMADIIAVAKAGLNDPQKPLGSLFFLGPTGVGKTECAKAMAQFLFGNEDRLIRFDMNEFVSPEAVARLVGTFGQPEGLLTGVVRRQPFGILLLDEVEKAHPDVFDLLLQVLGEARLSDALGRTTSFANMVIILTSNLGSRDADREIGFAGEARVRGETYLRAVRDHFRPEFFNRIDRIVAFNELSRDHLRKIAERLVNNVLAREGFSRRRSALDLQGGMLDWAVEHGYHPRLGARAMKRAIEDHIVQPVAERMAGVPNDLPTLVTLSRRRGLPRVTVIGLREAACIADEIPDRRLSNPEETLDGAKRALQRIADECEPLRPEGQIGAETLEPAGLFYFGISDQLRILRRDVASLREQLDQGRVRSPRPRFTSIRRIRRGGKAYDTGRRNFAGELFTAQDIHEYFKELCEEAARQARTAPLEHRLVALCRQIAFLEVLRPEDGGFQPEQVLAIVRGLPGSSVVRGELVRDLEAYRQLGWFDDESEFASPDQLEFGLDVDHWGDDADTPTSNCWWELIPDESLGRECRTRFDVDVVAMQGHKASALLESIGGTHLFFDESGQLKPVQVVLIRIDHGRTVQETLHDCLVRHLEAIEADDCSAQTALDPLAWQEVVAVYSKQSREKPYRCMLDFRLGLQATQPTGGIPASSARSAFPLPFELKD